MIMSIILAIIGFCILLPVIIYGIFHEEEWIEKERRFFRGLRRLVNGVRAR